MTILQLVGVSRSFGGVKAVDDISFAARRGEVTALIGANGAGKTTAFNIISGITAPDSGTIIFNDKNITNLPPAQIANMGISRVFQQPRLFSNLTVMENVRLAVEADDSNFLKSFLGLTKTTENKETAAAEALKTVRMSHKADELCRDLSYGQKKLAELGRALAKPHELLVLDEPMAGVNPVLRNEIASVLATLRKNGESILLIEHDMNFTLKASDHVVAMDAGRIIAQGTPAKIRADKRVLEAYLGE